MNKKVILACVDCGSRNYTTESNKETQTSRLELKKFCKTCNKHSLHRETK
ncbi:50S ribosomal protein L33 [Pseudoneobacillus sp. C159]